MNLPACQSCASQDLELMIHLGSHVLCNSYKPIGSLSAAPEQTYPIELLRCPRCELVQLGHQAPSEELFPSDYPYRSGTTKLLRDNFADLARDVHGTMALKPRDLVVDIGSNDGTLLSNFLPHCRVLGITPEDAAQAARMRGIDTMQRYFDADAVRDVCGIHGQARVVTAANVFAHVPDPNVFLENVKALLEPGGVFVVEAQYVHALIDKLQFDHLYPEHLRFYSLQSLANLLTPHGLEPFRVQHIATHGGSIRVWACRKGERPIEPSVATLAFWEHHRPINAERFARFGRDIARVRADLWRALPADGSVHGVGAPSRASVLVQYVGLDHFVMPVVYETPGSAKIGQWLPGSRIEVHAEPDRFGDDQPECLLLLSWHLDELAPKLRTKGFKGRLIRPLPEVEIIE